MATDAELLRSYAEAHSNPAFAEWVERYLPVVYNAALRRLNGNAHLAEEVCQVVFTQAARKAARLAGHPALLGWLHTSTRYAASALLRRERRRALRERLAASMQLDPPESPRVSWEELRPLIDGALDQLSATDRQAILLRFLANRSFAEIGAELMVSEEASRKRVDRALDSLRRRFARHGVTTSAAALATVLAEAPAAAAPVSLAGTIATTATASSSVSFGTAFVGLMSTIKWSSVATAVSLIGAATVGTALYTWSEQQGETQRSLAATEAQVSEVRGLLREKLAGAVISTVAAQPTGARGAGATVSPKKDAFVASILRTDEILASSPEYALLHRAELELRAEGEFGAFLASRAYSPEQLSAVRAALVEMYLAQEEEWAAFARAPAGTQIRPNLATGDRVKQITAGLRPLLADGDIEQLRRQFGARNWLKPARDVSADFADAGIPMAPMNELALAAIMADASAERKDAAKRVQSTAVDPVTGLTANEHAQLDDAAAFLTAEQLKVFERYLRAERESDELTRRARESL